MKKVFVTLAVMLGIGALVVFSVHAFNQSTGVVEPLETEIDADDTGYKNGIEKTYYDDGTVWSVASYKNGVLDGERTIYSQTGRVIEVKNFQDGKSHGITRGYYDDGTLEVEMMYANGAKNGAYHNFYPNGNPRLDLHYVNDIIDGAARWYNRDGSTHADAIFQNGKIISGHRYGETGTSSDMTEDEMIEYTGKTR